MGRISWIIVSFVLFICLLSLIFFFRHRGNPHELTLYGNVDVRQVDISFRVDGQVTDLYFEEGDLVNPGMLMAALDSEPYNELVASAEAKLAAVRVDLTNAEILLRRRQELIQVGGVSQEDLDDAKTRYEELQANLAQATADLAIAQDNLSYTHAFAPTEGIILTRIREPGTVVKVSDPVYTLSVSSPVWIRAFVSERHLGDIRFGMKADVYTDRKGGRVYHGNIGFISPIAEFTPKTVETTELRTDLVYRLRIYVDNPDQGLKQGMPVTVKLKI